MLYNYRDCSFSLLIWKKVKQRRKGSNMRDKKPTDKEKLQWKYFIAIFFLMGIVTHLELFTQNP